MSETLTVTALVPSYMRPDSLLRCLDALVSAERPPDELVLVLRDTDTASQEAFAAWREHTAPAFAVKLAIATAPGQIAAMNTGLPHATGDIICFPDDDSVPRPDWLARLLSHYGDPQVGGAGGRDVVRTAPDPPTVRIVGKLTWYGRVIGNHHCEAVGGPRFVDHIKGVNMSFRRALLPPFDPNIWGPHVNDTDIALCVSRQGWKLVYDPEARIDHYPAQRLDNPGGRNLLDPRLTFLDTHDWMYLVLKHQPWYLRGISALYILLVGTHLRPGLLLALTLAPRQPREAAMRWWASLRGALAGIGSWLRPRPA